MGGPRSQVVSRLLGRCSPPRPGSGPVWPRCCSCAPASYGDCSPLPCGGVLPSILQSGSNRCRGRVAFRTGRAGSWGHVPLGSGPPASVLLTSSAFVRLRGVRLSRAQPTDWGVLSIGRCSWEGVTAELGRTPPMSDCICSTGSCSATCIFLPAERKLGGSLASLLSATPSLVLRVSCQA